MNLPLRISSSISATLAALVLSAVSSSAIAAKAHPYSDDFQARIEQLFFEHGKSSDLKIDSYIGHLETKKVQIRSIFENDERRKGNRDPKKIEKKIHDEKILFAIDEAIKAVREMKTTTDLGRRYDLAAHALDIESAIKIDGAGVPILETLRGVAFIFKTWSIPKSSRVQDEASNLYDPSTKSYLTSQDLLHLRQTNADLSLYGPSPSSPFWEEPKNLKTVDVAQAAKGKTLKLYEGTPEIPTDVVFTFDEVKHSATKPKIDVFIRDANDKKQKYKLKFGAEIHADPSASALMMTLGYPADVVKHARDVKVVLGKKYSVSDLKRDWESYYSRESLRAPYHIEDYIKSEGTDEEGRNFVVFKETLIESKPPQIERIGGWSFKDNGHTDLREVRGLSLVQMWIDNSDIKEFNNNRLLLKTNSDNSVTRHLVISDVGHTFGFVFQEMPDWYTWTMVSESEGSQIKFRYRNFHPNSFRNVMTMSDARWAARLVAKLSRTQIEAAVRHGSWPDCMQKIYIEKLISRRNDMLQHLGLIGAKQEDGSTIALIPVHGPREDYEFKRICDAEEVAKKYTTEFEFDVNTVLDIATSGGKKLAYEISRAGIGGFRRITLSSAEFDLDPKLVSEVIVDLKREFERNPNPTSERDLHIIKDHFEVGLRLGVAYGIYKDFVYTRSYSLAYPARSVKESELNNGFVVNVLLPRHVRRGQVPESYVLKTEHYLENGAGVEFHPGGAVSPVFRAGVAKVSLWRSVYDHRSPEKYVLYRDVSGYNKAALELLARVFILRIPVFRTMSTWGSASGRGSTFTAEEIAVNKQTEASILKAIVNGDFSGVESKETTFSLSNTFKRNENAWRFLFWSGSRDKRLDQLSLTTGAEERSGIQFMTSRESKQNFFGDKEQKNIKVEVFTEASKDRYQINVDVVGLDINVKDRDMASKYLAFINGLSPSGEKLILLNPELGYTINGRWGAIVAKSETEYSPEAVAKILNATEGEIWTALSRSLGLTDAQFASLNARYKQALRHRDSTRRRQQILEAYQVTPDQAESLQETANFIKRLRNAKKEVKVEKRVRHLAEAFRKSVFVGQSGFYSPIILGALNRVAGEDKMFSSNILTRPAFKEMDLLGEKPIYAEIGQPLKAETKYLIFNPVTGLDLYTMFDSWF